MVTHGTNTMGYTTAAVSLALGNLGKAVLFTGSQVFYSIPGSDAIINLENILRVLKEKQELIGVFLIFGSKIISGMKVKKMTEFNYDAFKTFGRMPDIGYIGNSIILNKEALDDHLQYLGTKSKFRMGLDIKNKFDTNIASLTEFPGMDAKVIMALAEAGIKGFILRSSGAGDPNVASVDNEYRNLRGAFEYLRDNKIPIVVTTYAPDGVASMTVNEPGMIAKELGAIPAYDMSMETMVTKLSWLIAQGCS
jgi:L-asparaginase